MPEQPGFIEKVNYIKDFMCDPCEAPFIVYVETFLPAFGTLILEWYGMSLDDIIRGYFRPAGLASYGHKRRRQDRKKKKKKNKFVRALNEIIDFEPGEYIAKNLPLQQNFKSRKITNGLKTLWIIDGIIQRALYYWMVIDLTSDFLYNWTSLLMKTEYCQAQSQYFLLMENEEQIIYGNPGEYRIYLGKELKRRGDVYPGQISVILPGAGTVIAAGRLEPYHPEWFPPVTGYIKLVKRKDDRYEYLGQTNDFTDTTDRETGGVLSVSVENDEVMPVFVITGDPNTYYGSYLRNFTLIAQGHK